MKKEIYYSTSNPGKFNDVARYIEKHEPSIELKQFDGKIFEEQTNDTKAIAIDKARQSWQILKKPVLVDDAGIYFNQYNNFPGAITKFIIPGIGYDGVFALLKNDTRVHFLLHMVYIDSSTLQVFDGRCDGKIIRPQKFEAPEGLPWDAIFLPDSSSKTCTELRGTKEEQEYSYRLKAVKKFLEWYKNKES